MNSLFREATPLQTYLDINVLIYGGTSILVGMMLGYVIGSQRSLRPVDRILLGSILGLICGLIVSMIWMYFIPSGSASIIITVMAGFAGTLFGESLNWAPAPEKQPRRHVYFEIDDEDEFDREIEEALRGSHD